jgi:isopentenyldiphosphate isomerase
MTELRQLFNPQGLPIAGQGATKEDTLNQALLHAASHIWIWRRNNGAIELMFQKRAAAKLTWPNMLDISAAGHIDLGQEPIGAAIREIKEELSLELKPDDLTCYGVYRCYMPIGGSNMVENEFQWLYTTEFHGGPLVLQDEEVGEVLWKPVRLCQDELNDPELAKAYVPHGDTYWAMLFEAIERDAIQY